MTDGPILLLDLDGVVVFEGGAPWRRSEILALHERLAEHLAKLGLRTFVLTHRSRAEARRILEALQAPRTAVSGVLAAEDLFVSGVRSGQWRALAAGGLRKSLILPELERRLGVDRRRAVLIDDNIANVRDMSAAGLGLVLHAPSALDPNGRSMRTFDFAEAVTLIDRWSSGETMDAIVTLTPVVLALETLRRTGHTTAADARHLFNAIRVIVGPPRRFIAGRRSRPDS